MAPKVYLIAAASENHVIGQGNDLPWHLPADLKFFKTTTLHHFIIMGRKTWESVGSRPLPKRTTVVVTRQKNYQAKGARVATTIEEALQLAENEQQVFIVGGGQLYQKAMPLADGIYLTRIHAEFPGDTFFPEINESQWKLQQTTYHPADEKHEYPFSFQFFVPKHTHE